MKLKDGAYSLFYHHEQLKAAHARLNDTPDYFYRKVCRWYSETLNTPLKEVQALPYQDILKEYYEHNMENMSYNEVLEYTKSELLDVFVDREEEGMQQWAKELEQEQADGLKKKAVKKADKDARLKSIKEEKIAEEERQAKQTVQIPEVNRSFEDEEMD